jgi:hypothetical protein
MPWPLLCKFHLQSWSGKLILELMITEENKKRKAGLFLALPLSSFYTPCHRGGCGLPTQFSPIRLWHRTFSMGLWGKATVHPEA